MTNDELRELAKTIKEEMAAYGFTKVTLLDRRADRYDRLVRYLNTTKGTDYASFADSLVHAPHADFMVSYSMDRLSTPYYHSRMGYFFPQWALTLVEMEIAWRSSNIRGPQPHDDIMEAFQAGLEGDLQAVDNFIGGYELAKEYEAEHTEALVPEWGILGLDKLKLKQQQEYALYYNAGTATVDETYDGLDVLIKQR